jgi:hypothetical protein
MHKPRRKTTVVMMEVMHWGRVGAAVAALHAGLASASGRFLGGNTCNLSQPLASPMLQDQHERTIAQQHQRVVCTIKIIIAAGLSKSARADRHKHWC